MAKEYDRKNPTFATAQTGVAANHSSGQKSVADYANAQSDDEINDVPVRMDPNISGTAPTEDCYTWLAGKMDGWCENDDYRDYFEQSRGCDGMLAVDCHDGDYDDNGGYPTAVGHARGVAGAANEDSLGAEYQKATYSISPVYVRRA